MDTAGFRLSHRGGAEHRHGYLSDEDHHVSIDSNAGSATVAVATKPIFEGCSASRITVDGYMMIFVR